MRVAIDPISGCHNFLGCKTSGGYGRIRVGGVHWMAHRYALSVHLKRPLEEGCVVMHLCDNPACVNPEHLREGTQKENMQDCKDKGRMHKATGPRAPRRPYINKINQRYNERLKAVLEADGSDLQVAKKLGLNLHWVKKARAGKLVMQEV